ncbi:hypothetical protein DRO35_01755 [Candidatus Bathyarchaeota archaeon]|nr:MAG: hypothetical protein DRO35_01755 [Candidatus Bathyarchaeota archaeon]
MIKRILDFVLILLFVWACMILGLWLINEIVVPLEIPWIKNHIVIAIIKLVMSSGLALLWLWLWREIIKRMFWHTLKAHKTLGKAEKQEER